MRILIALTGHAIDDDIAATAARMFDPERDQIIAIHVAHPRETRATYGRIEPTDTAARGADLSAMSADRPLAGPAEGAEQAGERLSAEFRDHVRLLSARFLGGFEIEERLVVNGNPADAILEAIREHSIDAVTMGTRSTRSRLASALLGSEVEQVIRGAPVPVTVVKEGTAATAAASD